MNRGLSDALRRAMVRPMRFRRFLTAFRPYLLLDPLSIGRSQDLMTVAVSRSWGSDPTCLVVVLDLTVDSIVPCLHPDMEMRAVPSSDEHASVCFSMVPGKHSAESLRQHNSGISTSFHSCHSLPWETRPFVDLYTKPSSIVV